MRKLSKTLLSLLLIAAMLASFVVLPAAAEEPAAEQPTEAVQAAETQADDAEKSNYELSVVMLDCGRKYFSVDSIKQIIDNAAAAGFNNVMLAVGNDGMRFLLDDMSLTVNGTTYSSEEVAAAIHTGNEAYYNFTTDELTESEMDEIIAYAKTKGLGIIPVINTPGHMDAILDAARRSRARPAPTTAPLVLSMSRIRRLLPSRRHSCRSMLITSLPRAASISTWAQTSMQTTCSRAALWALVICRAPASTAIMWSMSMRLPR